MSKKSKRRTSIRDRVRQNSKENKQGGNSSTLTIPEGVALWSPEEGNELIDIVPYEVSVNNHPDNIKKGELWYKRPYTMHWLDQKPYICPRSIGKKCPFCEEYNRMMRDPDVDDATAVEIKPKSRVLYNKINEDNKIEVYDSSPYVFQDVLDDEILAGEDSYAGFCELEDGLTLKVRFGEKKIGKSGKFLEVKRIDFKQREDIDEDILDDVVDLDKALKVLSYEELEKVLFGLEEEEKLDEEEAQEDDAVHEEEEKPRRKRKPKKETKVESEDEEEPIRRTRKKVRKQEEDDSVDEEEEKPKKKETKKTTKVKTKTKNKCQFGGQYGVDCNKLDDCTDCDDWDDCIEEQDKLDDCTDCDDCIEEQGKLDLDDEIPF